MSHALQIYDYALPAELIAQHPLPRRDESRLMVVERNGGLAHRRIRDLPALLRPGDCLVFNDTRVVPARLFGVREATGGKWEGLYLSTGNDGRWRLIGQTRGRLQPGERIVLHAVHRTDAREKFRLRLLACDDDGIWTAEPEFAVSPLEVLQRFGTVPLPPYIERKRAEADDFSRYQTVYARHPGAVAAPTAGLHFTPELLRAIRNRGVGTEFVTLHVGIGTFRPIAVSNLNEHRMHAEWCRVTPEVADRLNAVRCDGGRIVAVGTTAVRTLESAFADGRIRPVERETDLFIRPPYEFRAVDALLTNFHLPKSSLLVLVAALLGVQRTLDAYQTAVRERYRFYSYGDAMLIV